MNIHNPPATLAGSTLLIPRNERYETKKKPSPPRDVTTQVRDWFHSARMTEIWIEPGLESEWTFKQRLVLTLSRRDPKTCQIVLRPWVVREIRSAGLINRLSHTVVVNSGRELRLVHPFIRLALDPAESCRLNCVNRIHRDLKSEELKRLQKMFVNGLHLNEEAIFGSAVQS